MTETARPYQRHPDNPTIVIRKVEAFTWAAAGKDPAEANGFQNELNMLAAEVSRLRAELAEFDHRFADASSRTALAERLAEAACAERDKYRAEAEAARRYRAANELWNADIDDRTPPHDSTVDEMHAAWDEWGRLIADGDAKAGIVARRVTYGVEGKHPGGLGWFDVSDIRPATLSAARDAARFMNGGPYGVAYRPVRVTVESFGEGGAK